MKTRQVNQIIHATAVSEGAGVTVYRTIGTPALRNLDPFLMLDYFNSDNSDDYIAGFPDHPHRGFVTFTYMLDGHMLHQDSMGNQGDLLSGGAQWMKAASGVIHSEMPQQTAGLMRGFQLWINLPAKEKLNPPAYQEIPPHTIPTIENDGIRVKVLCGAYQDQQGPVDDPITNVHYLDITLGPNTNLSHSLDPNLDGFVYIFEGDAVLANNTLLQHTFAVLGSGDRIEITAGKSGTRLILVAGRPINEPIVQYGPFVMNTQQEIQQALTDFRNGQLVRNKAAVVSV